MSLYLRWGAALWYWTWALAPITSIRGFQSQVTVSPPDAPDHAAVTGRKTRASCSALAQHVLLQHPKILSAFATMQSKNVNQCHQHTQHAPLQHPRSEWCQPSPPCRPGAWLQESASAPALHMHILRLCIWLTAGSLACLQQLESCTLTLLQLLVHHMSGLRRSWAASR